MSMQRMRRLALLSAFSAVIWPGGAAATAAVTAQQTALRGSELPLFRCHV